jgi:GNAT superfamily N-acetyltransferase
MAQISQLAESFIPWLKTGYEKMGWGKDEGYFENCYAQHQAGELVVLVSHEDTAYFGHLKLVWKPEYVYFRDNNVPEIQDLNVIPEMRQQGIATELITRAENLALASCKAVGIRVGLLYWYGPAQRLYAKRGYIPDGQGIYFNNIQKVLSFEQEAKMTRVHCQIAKTLNSEEQQALTTYLRTTQQLMKEST